MTAQLASGQVLLDRYRLDRRLDEGGMSVVWAGTHLVTGKEVALKLLKADAAKDDATRRRMLREARAACAVRHPNVVEIHDVLELPDGSPVLVMDLLHGESLRDRLIRRKTLGMNETATLLLPVISGVGTAHAAGVIHRDLKPDNIFIADEAGRVRVKVLDFGIAKVVASASNLSQANALTNTGTMLGTPYYMAPEQILGEAIDHRADIWSLGVILYECLVGERPTEAENVGKILKKVLTNEIEPLSSRAPDLPKDVTSLVDRMLSQAAKDRPANVREVGDVLAPYAEGVTLGLFGPPATVASPDSADSGKVPVRSGPGSEDRSSRTPGSRPGAGARTASELAETLVAPRPAELRPRVGTAAMTAPGVAAGDGEGERESARGEERQSRGGPRVAVAALIGILVLGGAAGAYYYGGGKERPYLAANPTATEAPSGPCPPGMVLLPAGTFRMGSDDGKDDERPQHELAMGAFCMDVSEVSAAEYQNCMQRGSCRPAESTVRWMDIPDEVKDRESMACTGYQTTERELPMNCISWSDAEAYCQAGGKRLPTEAEWEYAAGGGPEHRRFPWGSAPPGPRMLNTCDKSCAEQTEKRTGDKKQPMFDADDGFPGIAPPGKFPDGDSKQGLHDMAGNVWEWTASPYCTYPEHACSSPYRVFRGGGWGGTLSQNARVTARMWSNPSHRYNDVGFRCVKDAP